MTICLTFFRFDKNFCKIFMALAVSQSFYFGYNLYYMVKTLMNVYVGQ
ncbi:MAG: hypothetical protein GQF41_1013 [Candidatus Rifleibacterium amylolyticum]|nr:MAG: hypothetical protein GQF41_1013 [Candidatus Rifleibacterium amylolyticum]